MKNTWKKSDLIAWFKEALQDQLSSGELHEILLRLLEHDGISRLDWATLETLEVDEPLWCNYVDDLKKDKPIQYIVGYEYFLGEKFIVNQQVLIPRPETEELVQWVLDEHASDKSPKILEVGTGSGCIALGLKKSLPASHIVATDVSRGALELAQVNAENLGLAISFVQDDILDSQLEDSDWDIIVSNPPYIPLEEANVIEHRVKAYEPHIALFTKEKNPMQFYQAILEYAMKNLKNKGSLYFEVHEDYAKDVYNLAKKNALLPEYKLDFYGKQRMIKIINLNNPL